MDKNRDDIIRKLFERSLEPKERGELNNYEFKFRKYSNNVIKKAKEFDNSMIITILMSPNKRYSTL